MPCLQRGVIICAAGNHTSSAAAYEKHADCTAELLIPPHTKAVFVLSATAVCKRTARSIDVRVVHALDVSNVYTVFKYPAPNQPNTYGRASSVIIWNSHKVTGNGGMVAAAAHSSWETM
jgi:hypothetical protein